MIWLLYWNMGWMDGWLGGLPPQSVRTIPVEWIRTWVGRLIKAKRNIVVASMFSSIWGHKLFFGCPRPRRITSWPVQFPCICVNPYMSIRIQMDFSPNACNAFYSFLDFHLRDAWCTVELFYIIDVILVSLFEIYFQKRGLSSINLVNSKKWTYMIYHIFNRTKTSKHESIGMQKITMLTKGH